MMMKIIRTSTIIIINLIIVFLALLLYGFTEPIIKITGLTYGIQKIIFLPIFLAGLILFIAKKKFRPFGIALIACCISGLIFLVFFINAHFATKGTYQSFKLEQATYYINKSRHSINFRYGYYLGKKINHNMIKEVQPDKCFSVDSIHIRIDNGLFGMKTMTNEINIKNSSNCFAEKLDSNNLRLSHYKTAYKLFYKRCFPSAIQHLSTCIELDPIVPDSYLLRGSVYMVLGKYKKSLNDYLIAISLMENGQKVNQPVNITKDQISDYYKYFILKIKNDDDLKIDKTLEEIRAIRKYNESHYKSILFLIKKLKEEQY